MKTPQQIEEMAKVHALNSKQYIAVLPTNQTVRDEKEASYIEGATWMQKDLLDSASEGFEEAWLNPENNDFIYAELSAEVKETSLLLWQACALSKMKEIQEIEKRYEKTIDSYVERIKKLEFMLENGLGWEDMKSDGANGEGADR